MAALEGDPLQDDAWRQTALDMAAACSHGQNDRDVAADLDIEVVDKAPAMVERAGATTPAGKVDRGGISTRMASRSSARAITPVGRISYCSATRSRRG